MVTKDNLKTAISLYIEDIFNSFEFNIMTAMKKIAVKLALENKFDMVDLLLDEQKMIDVDKLKEIAMPEIKKLGKVEIGGIRFDEKDFTQLLDKIREFDNGNV